jgi:hypothetical protein
LNAGQEIFRFCSKFGNTHDKVRVVNLKKSGLARDFISPGLSIPEIDERPSVFDGAAQCISHAAAKSIPQWLMVVLPRARDLVI